MARKVMEIPNYQKGKFYYVKNGVLYEEDRNGMNKKRKGSRKKGSKKGGKKRLFGIF